MQDLPQQDLPHKMLIRTIIQSGLPWQENASAPSLKTLRLTANPQTKNLQKTFGFRSALLVTSLVIGVITAPAIAAMATDRAEVRQGKKLYAEIMSTKQAYNDPELQTYINKVGQRLVQVSSRPNLEFTFTVIDEPAVNAYAVPGGFIFVDRGLLAYLNNESQLAAVLAHEIGHVTARHSSKKRDATRAAKAFSGLATLTTYWYTGSTKLADIPSYMGHAWIRGYGRDMELEADGLGAEYLLRAGYDQDAMLEVIGILKYQQLLQRRVYKQRSKRPPSYHGVFSTHPQNDKRLHAILSNTQNLPQVFNSTGPIGDYLAQIDGLAYGYSADSGFDSGNTYYDRPRAIQLDFPDGWHTSIQGNLVLGHPVSDPQDAYVFMRIQAGASPAQSPQDYLHSTLGLSNLENAKLISVNGFSGMVADVLVASASFQKRRVAVLFGANKAYEFLGATTAESLQSSWLKAFNDILESLQTLPDSEGFQAAQKRLRLYTTQEKENYASLLPNASKMTLDGLRLLNGDYPKGEFGPGERIKLLH